MTGIEAMTMNSLNSLLTEIYDGASPEGGWILNPGSEGILGLLDKLTAEQASRRAIPGRSSIAAHTDHLRYSLSLLNRWANGEENPFATADWKASWKLQVVTGPEWDALRQELRREVRSWMEAIPIPREWSEITLGGAISSAAHAAYHLGVIRQYWELLRDVA